MSDCANQNNQTINGANPNSQKSTSSALEINLTQESLNLFNPNAALAALQTFNELNKTANKMFGVEARWFRAIPQQRSKDVIFQEYTLKNVSDTPVCLKVLVPDGNFVDSNYTYDLMGLEYNVPQEIHIDKGYWEELAGYGTAPQRKDIVYLSLPNKLYQVESSYLKRGFMEQETTWIINLTKYQPEASRRESDVLKETIDTYTVSEEEIFGVAIDKEIEKLVDDKQMSPFNSTSEDKYKTINKNLQIISANIDIYGIIAAQTYYDLETSDVYTAVSYNASDVITTSDDRSIVAWINHKDKSSLKEFDIVWIQKDETITSPANYKIKIKTSQRFNLGDTFVIYRQGTLNFYAEVIDDSHSASNVYYCKIDDDVEKHLLSIKSDWTNAKNYKMKIKNPITIINGLNNSSSSFSVKLYANQYIKINYGTQEHVACMTEKLEDKTWYGIVANIGNTWGQYNVYVWEKHPTSSIEQLKIKFYNTIKFIPESLTIDQYTLSKSYSYITNIRLFKTTIEEEKQTNELLSYFTKDADQAIILDNVDPSFKPSYISQQR